MNQPKPVLDRIMAVIEARKNSRPEDSYTARLMAGGHSKIGEKIVEEAAELVEAAAESGSDGQAHVIHEAADLVFHVLVLLGHRGLDLSDVENELARREGISGLEEKASRGTESQPEQE